MINHPTNQQKFYWLNFPLMSHHFDSNS